MSANTRTPEQDALLDAIWAAYGERWPLPMYTATPGQVLEEFTRRGYRTVEDIPRFMAAVGFDRWYEYDFSSDDMQGWHPVYIKYLNAYETGQQYGGPEEGGWYYEVGDPLASVPLRIDALEDEVETARENLRELLRRTLRGGDLQVYLEDHVAAPYPQTRPHYE